MNFSFYQDSIDLFLGNYVINEWEGTPLQYGRSWRVTAVSLYIVTQPCDVIIMCSIFISVTHSDPDRNIHVVHESNHAKQ